MRIFMKRLLRSSTDPKESASTTMSDASPTKRRKLKGANIMKPKKVTWPPNVLPVEIFTLIVSYLPRSNIQNLRLVNKEFDRKVSEALFRVVVVPFRPEIYGITPEPPLSYDALQGSIMLQDKGMRVFQGFGRWIQKFAMSFEIDLNKLANPPLKCDQEAITTFWGIYKWPFKVYNRYSQLEGLEQTADETRTMAKALMFIESAKELGLSIDGGLGWLPGPDINTRVAERGEKLAVFGASRFVPESKPRLGRQGKASSIATNADSVSGTYSQYERMLQDAGYQEDDLESAVRLFLETEEFGAPPLPNFQGDTSAWDSFGLQPAAQQFVPETWRRLRRRDALLNGSNGSDSTDHGVLSNATVELASLTDEDDDGFEQPDYQSTAAYSYPTKLPKGKNDGCLLKPNDLSNAQREMLLEMEWAQNAFMQSWAIAIIDNQETFSRIRTLNIARLPSRHLPILRREDFWDSLPELGSLSLAIIPDWREVRKEATSWVEDNRVAPSRAVVSVYELLSQQISRRENIKSLHFEWLCGGEYAPGLFARNQHILAAPVVAEAMHMVNRSQQHSLLALPNVERLSLKNCWLTPHIMRNFLLPMKQTALQSLTLDSVSLTAPLPQNASPNHMTPAVVVQNAQHMPVQGGPIGANVFGNLLGGLNAQNQAPVAPPPPAPVIINATDLAWFETPRPGSWADIIDHLTPGTTLEAIRHAREMGPEPEPRAETNLSKLSFTSCGYVRLPLDFDQTILDAPQGVHQQAGGTVTKRMNDIDCFMMKAQDHALAVVANHMSQLESATLENAWDMTVGWRDSRPELLPDAQLDGCMLAGFGRFDGLIEVARPPKKPSRDY
ncbi:uncharacterized protein LY89DRAFT_417116 [Mollisia scopiformis]|uniref:F-box domain-containing protein n=1 Tax=Mollisia scopiformis TaxID=149040 RepID=A0A194XKW6_MOLSC|nr:uncharacterized protein LY89DRAFT_417116 [Mollisia scopiformis]KUJ20875.1 hypothetical protein LY89DRAFT_417116 [Mollisia scopiformis]